MNAVESITRGQYWANGPYIDQFEEKLKSFFDIEHAVVFNTGTTALVSALRAHGIGEGDEVIVPSFTFVSTANAVRIVGAEPVFADIERDRYGLDPESVADLVSDDTAGIIPVHYAGSACRIESLSTIAEQYDLVLIEDAAEAFGATANGNAVGTFGDSAMLSFCQNKVVATGEGGAVITDDADLAADLRLIRSHGRASGDYFESSSTGQYRTLGNNFRMPDVVASLGVAQLDRVDELIRGRRRVAKAYADRIDAIDGVEPMTDPADGRHVYQLYPVTFDAGIDRDAVIESLAERGVSSKVYFEPVHQNSYYRETYDRPIDRLSTTVDIASRVLSLPIHPELTTAEIDHVSAALTVAIEEEGQRPTEPSPT
ncbi:DegT/DnrJ/EryC1/StrS family aminotransferase [Haladaptatus caseinilyticus]|uniref:DegT/DnrJ/EryC1/StrS family aminotransferase n=1 Tax=Haladaptatus caseinilyticus TaxID=2993314 RepID=UPI00224B6107|nr:DegT/DnrJ/EryC1/StrS family aminotransferase [Haladaptatus caseinilyticus]